MNHRNKTLQISNGDLTKTIDIQTNDVIGNLASNFNKAVKDLSTLQHEQCRRNE